MVLACLVFPLIIGAIYALPLPQYIAVDAGDLLAFYGTAFGIFVSFYIYQDEKKKIIIAQKSELRPKLLVRVERHNDNENLFDIMVTNQSERMLSYFSMYDTFISEGFPKENKLTVSYCQSTEEQEELNAVFNFTSDDEIIDDDGYPKYIQIICDDAERHSWNCNFFKVRDGSKVFYYPRDWEVM